MSVVCWTCWDASSCLSLLSFFVRKAYCALQVSQLALDHMTFLLMGPIGELPGQVFSVRYFVFETHGSISE